MEDFLWNYIFTRFTSSINIELKCFSTQIYQNITIKNIYTRTIFIDTGFFDDGFNITKTLDSITLFSIKNLESISVAIYGAYDEEAGVYINGYYQYLATSNWWNYQGNRYFGTKQINQSIINSLKQSNSNILNLVLRVYDPGGQVAGGGARGYFIFTITEISS